MPCTDQTLSCAGLVVLALSFFVSLSPPSVRADSIPSDVDDAITYLDLTYLNHLDLADGAQAREAWDTLHMVATVQGIVNRDRPRLYIRFIERADDFWWAYLREEGQWLDGREVVRVRSLEQLLARFEHLLKGIVVYRERPWVSSNLASTIAGVEDRVALRYSDRRDSVCQRVLRSGLDFVGDRFDLSDERGRPIWSVEDEKLGTTSGSVKCDAYRWLRRHYLDTGRVSAEYMGYYIDAFWLTDPDKSQVSNCTLSNHDFFIAQRSLFFDLHVWGDETPVDDPSQAEGTDVATLHHLLHGMQEHADGEIYHIGGFTPWAWKYTSHPGAGSRHGPVPTEWKMVRETSAYNGYIDADALGFSGMANASFYQHFPLREHYPQNTKPTDADLRRSGFLSGDNRVADQTYVLLYMGDYDSAAWFYQRMPDLYNDSARGDLTCNWAFSPILDRRAPHVMHYVRTRSTDRDWFVTSDNGAGYLNPSMLTAPRQNPAIEDGWEAWIRHNQQASRRYDLTIVGFLIDGFAPDMGRKGMDGYSRISPDGIVRNQYSERFGLHDGVMPYVRATSDIGGTPEQAAARVLARVGEDPVQFLMFRSILQSPVWHQQVIERIKEQDPEDRIRFLDAYSFFRLVRHHEQSRR
ncbi:GxGYxYP domain-containing protein [Mucisphaera calidilacus]|uniref:Uncharacterized protein n=1 Tax=Mucisphaera calidilacus TaxID=2527982 RepID=A0A518BWZ0_9BACT|nr:GxGYxYP domain-containing protein [Mucisphaera calidilacus]QDU71454.1 hypothetical protein Pan265_13040 [Mucisphaera calidilacus]